MIGLFDSVQNFTVTENQLIEKEYEAEKEEFETLIKNQTPAELQTQGLAFNKLKLLNIKFGLYNRVIAVFSVPSYSSKAESQQTKLPNSKIQVGDNVSIQNVSETLSNELSRGIVYKKNEHKVQIIIEQDIENLSLPTGIPYVIVLSSNDVTFKRQKQVLKQIEKNAENSFNVQVYSNLAHILLQFTLPATGFNPNIQRKYVRSPCSPPLKFKNEGLNEEQKLAITFSLEQENLALVHGPPGTGKTSTICELIYQSAMQGQRVLACAASNIAVDNIVEKLYAFYGLNVLRVGNPARMSKSVQDSCCLDKKLLQNPVFKQLKDQKRELNRLLRKLTKAQTKDEKKALKGEIIDLKKDLKQQETLSLQEVFGESQVICCTNTGAADKLFHRIQQKAYFDLLVIDECAQATEISCWIPLIMARKLVLAGDHKQLPPTIKSREKLLELTLFDRVQQKYPEQCILLREQYRMNSKIMNWSSQFVYSNQLRAAMSVADHTLGDISSRTSESAPFDFTQTVLMFIDTAFCKMGESMEGLEDKACSKMNEGECGLVFQVYRTLKEYALKDSDIGVITPYNAQVGQLRKKFETEEPQNEVEISTVDGFQGREKECIIISMVRSNPISQVGFLNDFRRMNVAITRAKRFVCLIGDSDTVKNDGFLNQIIQYFKVVGEVQQANDYRGFEHIKFDIGWISKQIQQKKEKQPKPKEVAKQIKTKHQIAQQVQCHQPNQQNENKPQKHHGVQLNDEQEVKDEFSLQLIEFINSDQQSILFEQINSFKRKMLYDLLETYNLQHETIILPNVTKIKNVKVFKKQQSASDKGLTEEQQISTQLSSEQTINQLHMKDSLINPPHIKSDITSLNAKTVQINEKTSNIFENPSQIQEKPNQTQQNAQITENKATEEVIKNKKKNKKTKEPEIKETDDDFLERIIREKQQTQKNPKFCYFTNEDGIQCNKIIEFMKLTCKYCEQFFCMNHAMAEYHGCGDQAKQDARQQYLYQMKNGGGKKPEDRDEIAEKLHQKLKSQQQKRLPQTKKGAKK